MFPLSTDTHKDLETFLLDNRSSFKTAHFQWIINQVVNDSSEEKAFSMFDHAKKVCVSLDGKAV